MDRQRLRVPSLAWRNLICPKKLVRLEYCATIAAAKELLCRMSDESGLKLEVG